MSMIRFCDLRARNAPRADAIKDAVARVVDRGLYVLDAEVSHFEKDWSAYCLASHCVGVASGLDALTLILRAAKIGPGDEVIVPSNTYVATWLAVSAVGALPVAAEPDLKTMNICAATVSPLVNRRTKAILPVHLYGREAPIDELRQFHLPIYVDACQGHGLTAVGDAAAFSFYPTKNLGALGDGGAVVTDNDVMADQVRLMRNYGQRARYICDVRGINSRLDEVQAAILETKLHHLDWDNSQRVALAKRYLHALAGIPSIILPEDDVANVWHQFVIRVKNRDDFRVDLSNHDVETGCHYPVPPHLQGAYYIKGLRYPIAEEIAETCVSLPIGPELDWDDQTKIIDAIKAVV